MSLIAGKKKSCKFCNNFNYQFEHYDCMLWFSWIYNSIEEQQTVGNNLNTFDVSEDVFFGDTVTVCELSFHLDMSLCYPLQVI